MYPLSCCGLAVHNPFLCCVCVCVCVAQHALPFCLHPPHCLCILFLSNSATVMCISKNSCLRFFSHPLPCYRWWLTATVTEACWPVCLMWPSISADAPTNWVFFLSSHHLCRVHVWSAWHLSSLHANLAAIFCSLFSLVCSFLTCPEMLLALCWTEIGMSFFTLCQRTPLFSQDTLLSAWALRVASIMHTTWQGHAHGCEKKCSSTDIWSRSGQ